MGRALRPAIRGYLRRPLDWLFSGGANMAVLRALAGVQQATGREVARLAGLNAQAAHQALTRLEAFGVVRRSFAGRSHIFSLHGKHYLVDTVLRPALDAERNLREKLEEVLSRAAGGRAVAGFIFGSVARGEEGPESDFDVCVVVEMEAEREPCSERMRKIFDEVWERYGLKLATLVVTRREFAKGVERRDSVYKKVTSEGSQFLGRPVTEVIRGKADTKKSR